MSVRQRAEVAAMRAPDFAALAVVAALSLAGCASSAPGSVNEATGLTEPATLPTADAEPSWATPPLGNVQRPPARRAVNPQPRASTFANAAKLREPFYSNEQLRRNFMSIAMRAEAADDVDFSGNITVAKWLAPLRYRLVGANANDTKRVEALVAHLRRLTGIDIAPAVARQPNVRLSFVPFRTRNNAVYRLASEGSLGPAVGGMVTRWRDTEREKCLGLISVDPRSGAITKADILIKDELPPRIRDACIVEELVQSLGLMNDDPRARPSIFNDSQEYLDLTSHDEYLLRILYDRRVRPGMTLRQMNPLVQQIIREVRPVPGPNRGQA